MPYWMMHPDHGRTAVYDQGAVDTHVKHGWKLVNMGEEPEFPPKEEAAAPAGEPQDDAPAAKPGRKAKAAK